MSRGPQGFVLRLSEHGAAQDAWKSFKSMMDLQEIKFFGIVPREISQVSSLDGTSFETLASAR
eukprot:1136465-Pelagomonas_calceolata.AAC.1